jgi:hypothetical protein
VAAKAPAKPGGKGVKGKGLNGKIGPVPVKVVIFLVALVGGYLLYRHYKGAQTTSAGTNATPAADSTLGFPPADSTGGGASGAGSSPDTNFPVSGSVPTNQFPPIYNYYLSGGTGASDGTQPASGGNTSTPTFATAASSSQPTSSFATPALSSQVANAFYASATQAQPSSSVFDNILAEANGTGSGVSGVGAGAGASVGSTGPAQTLKQTIAKGSGGTAVGGTTPHKLGGGL